MKYSFILLFALLIATIFPSQAKNYDLGKYGLKPDSRENSALLLSSAIQKIVREHHSNSPVVLQFPEGTYHSTRQLPWKGNIIFPTMTKITPSKWESLWRD